MKKFISALLSAAFLSTFAGCTAMSDAENMGESLTDSAESIVSQITDVSDSDRISESKAKEIALRDADLSEDKVNFSKTELDRDNGGEKYEIDFTANGVEYEYEIDAARGTILSSKKGD